MSNLSSPSSLVCERFGRVTVYRGRQGGKYPDGNQVLVQGGDTQVAFDTPLISNEIGDAFDRTELVLLGHVHEDHMAGLHRLPHALVYAHRLDAPAARSWDALFAAYGIRPERKEGMLTRLQQAFNYAPRPEVRAYEDGQVWELGGGCRVTAVHMPGHTAGHSVLVVEPEGVAFIGDVDLSSFGPYYGDATSNLQDFRHTLERLHTLDASVWVTSHHRGVYTDRAAFRQALQGYASKLEQRTETLLQRLREAPQSLARLAEHGLLYPPGIALEWAQDAELRTIAQHLEELQTQGLVAQDAEGCYHLNA